MAVLSLRDVSCVAHGRRILDRLNLELGQGDRVAILGPNGGGKSLLARVAGGLETPTSGAVAVFGEAWSDPEAALGLRRRVGVGLTQPALLSDLSAYENVRFQLGRGARDTEARAQIKVERALADAGVEYCADQPILRLSAGERRRVDVARLLVTDPELLILDDLTNGLDEEGAEDLLGRLDRLIERRGRALLWIGGSRRHAERLASRVLKLEIGRLSPPQQDVG